MISCCAFAADGDDATANVRTTASRCSPEAHARRSTDSIMAQPFNAEQQGIKAGQQDPGPPL